ncbi:putative Se/S carrier-like protein [Porcipelethomonas sp.]|uniref:putative Se/S carrier-like protein n=1 Tax=Porcipelethomonas sp. TaxID=2981675 RepID=UPI003EF66728
MNTTAVSMPSVTHAIKAKRFLNSQGYSCEIKRSPVVSENGCTHMILVNADPEIVIALLDKRHIEHGKLLGEGMP